MDTKSKREIFIKINEAVHNCKKCRLHKNRTNAVPGEGNINADIVFIGEAPGAREDALGRPFVGRSGNMLEEMLRKIGLSRKDVWIGNVIKCRPPENRDPMVDEIRACSPYLEKQLELINPKLIITLGRFAMDFFLPKAKISEVHGTPYRVKSFIIYPLYHPAAALRNGSLKKVLLEDFINIKKILKLDKKDIPFYGNQKDTEEDKISLF